MYSGKAIEGRYFIAVSDLKGRPFLTDEIRLHDNGDNWRDGVKAAISDMVDSWNREHPEQMVNLNSEAVRHVHYAMKHRSRDKGFILTHSFNDCKIAAARFFVREAIDGGFVPKGKRDRHDRRRP